MGSKRTNRRELLKGGAALAGGITLGELASSQAQAHDHPMTPGSQNASPMILGSKELVEYGQRSRYVTSVRIQHPPPAAGLHPTCSGKCSTWPRRCRILLA